MRSASFKLTQEQLGELLANFKHGKNSDIGKMAIEVVKLYFLSLDRKATFQMGKTN